MEAEPNTQTEPETQVKPGCHAENAVSSVNSKDVNAPAESDREREKLGDYLEAFSDEDDVVVVEENIKHYGENKDQSKESIALGGSKKEFRENPGKTARPSRRQVHTIGISKCEVRKAWGEKDGKWYCDQNDKCWYANQPFAKKEAALENLKQNQVRQDRSFGQSSGNRPPSLRSTQAENEILFQRNQSSSVRSVQAENEILLRRIRESWRTPQGASIYTPGMITPRMIEHRSIYMETRMPEPSILGYHPDSRFAEPKTSQYQGGDRMGEHGHRTPYNGPVFSSNLDYGNRSLMSPENRNDQAVFLPTKGTTGLAVFVELTNRENAKGIYFFIDRQISGAGDTTPTIIKDYLARCMERSIDKARERRDKLNEADIKKERDNLDRSFPDEQKFWCVRLTGTRPSDADYVVAVGGRTKKREMDRLESMTQQRKENIDALGAGEYFGSALFGQHIDDTRKTRTGVLVASREAGKLKLEFIHACLCEREKSWSCPSLCSPPLPEASKCKNGHPTNYVIEDVTAKDAASFVEVTGRGGDVAKCKFHDRFAGTGSVTAEGFLRIAEEELTAFVQEMFESDLQTWDVATGSTPEGVFFSETPGNSRLFNTLMA
ncbi:hypothetical protein Ddc_15438 [Ditylenchus destructor]|nr:hypothetical protein Ddc_15438 [Ditylenchus destructor]